jgi:antitoxin YefM
MVTIEVILMDITNVAEFIPVSKAKSRLLALIRELDEHQGAVALTRDGVPAAMLLSMDHFLGLIETIELLADSRAMRSLRRSLKQAQRAEWVSHDKVFGKAAR